MKLDRRDEVSFGLTPVVPVPRFGKLDDLAIGRVRYLVAANGMFIEGRSRALHGCIAITHWVGIMPFGTLKPFMRASGGPVPTKFYREFVEVALKASPNEAAGLILWRNGAYELVLPKGQERSVGRVSYSMRGIDPLDAVVDMHSHGELPAYFSGQDDADDLACPSPCFNAMVFGALQANASTSVGRLIINGWAAEALAAAAEHLGGALPPLQGESA